MTTEDGLPEGPEPRRRAPNVMLIVAAIAFLAGLTAMALGMRWYLGERASDAAVTATIPGDVPAMPVARAPVTLEARADTMATRIAELERRLDDVDTGSRAASSFASRAEGLMVAFAARRALDRGLALGYVEDQLRLRFADAEPEAVAVVIRSARQPVTLGDLREALDKIAPSLLRTEISDGWWEGLRRSFASMIVIRQRGTQSPRPSDRLERARRRLNEGQVEGAVAEVARLPGSEAAESWRIAATRYVNARRALDRIETAAIQGQGRLLAPPTPLIAIPDPSILPDPATLPGAAVPEPAPPAAPSPAPAPAN